MVLGISVDEDKAAYEKFLPDNHVVFPTYRDAPRKPRPTTAPSMYPETYLIDRQGRLARKIVGPQDWQSPEIMKSIDVLLESELNFCFLGQASACLVFFHLTSNQNRQAECLSYCVPLTRAGT